MADTEDMEPQEEDATQQEQEEEHPREKEVAEEIYKKTKISR